MGCAYVTCHIETYLLSAIEILHNRSSNVEIMKNLVPDHILDFAINNIFEVHTFQKSAFWSIKYILIFLETIFDFHFS